MFHYNKEYRNTNVLFILFLGDDCIGSIIIPRDQEDRIADGLEHFGQRLISFDEERSPLKISK